MTKTFFNRINGNASVFDDDASLADWPDFQEFPLSTSVTREEVHSIRGHALQVSDWMAVSDRTITQEQRDYRQALRDITLQTPYINGDYDDIVWPTKPVDPSSY